MTLDCTGCAAPTDAPLCRPCTRVLAKTLKQLPSLVDELLTTVTKQSRLDQPSRIEVQLPAEWTQADAEHAKIPARLRSEYSRVALPATRLPVALGAALLHRQAVAGILSWGPGGDVRGVCTAIRANLDAFRQRDDAPAIHARALDLAATIEATIDRRPPDVFAGKCDAVGVRVDRLVDAGPTCGLHCAHVSCTVIRSRHVWLSPVAGPCGETLTAPAGSSAVTCPACGTEHDIAERRGDLVDRIGDELRSVSEASAALRAIGLEVTVDKVDGWLRRGRITDHGTGPHGRLVKVGEVRAYAEHLAARPRSPRRKISA